MRCPPDAAGYTNRGAFTFVIQAFPEPGAGIGRQPREDGEVPKYPWNGIPEGTYSRRKLREALDQALAQQGPHPKPND